MDILSIKPKYLSRNQASFICHNKKLKRKYITKYRNQIGGELSSLRRYILKLNAGYHKEVKSEIIRRCDDEKHLCTFDKEENIFFYY